MVRKFGRYIIFFLCTAALIFILVTLILPSTGKVVKEVYIPVKKEVVFNQLTNMGSYSSWYPWVQMDPSAEVTVADNGRSFSWKGMDKNTEGVYRIGDIIADSSLPFTLRYGSVPAIRGAYILRAAPDGKSTTVIWYMNMKAGWTPWWRFYAAMLNKLTGPVMEAGLTNLKLVCQQADSYSATPIRDTILAQAYLATVTDTVTAGRQYAALSGLFSRLQSFIRLRHLSNAGHPQARFGVLNDSILKIQAAIPVKKPFASQRDVALAMRPAEHVLSADFQGKYKALRTVYKALSDAASRYASSVPAPLWETYQNDVIPRSDTSFCDIRLYYAIKYKR